MIVPDELGEDKAQPDVKSLSPAEPPIVLLPQPADEVLTKPRDCYVGVCGRQLVPGGGRGADARIEMRLGSPPEGRHEPVRAVARHLYRLGVRILEGLEEAGDRRERFGV